MTMTKKLPFLVVSSSPYMRGILKFVLETMLHTDVTELESEERALTFLKTLEHVPSMIVYDYTPNTYLLEDFIGYLRNHSKLVKIVILVDVVREEGRELLKDHQHMMLLDESTLPLTLIQEAKLIFEGSQYVNDEPYCRIDIGFLSILDGINKNLFIKIGHNKFIKLFNEDETTEIVDIQKYRARGINYLYLLRETADWVTGQIQRQIDIFLKANNFRFVLRGATESAEKRFEQKLLRIDEEVHVDKEFKESIEASVERIRGNVDRETRIDSYLKVLRERQDQMAFFTLKINLVSLISCALARELQWISKVTMDKLVYAAVLCDITLAVRPDLLRIRNLEEFEKIKHELSEEDQKLFLSHSKDGANLIKRYFSSAPPDTDAIAFQHHELPDGEGFPHGLRAEKISPLSALFIIATDFTYYFLLEEEPSLEEYLLRCQGRYDYVNFRKVLKAFEKIQRKS